MQKERALLPALRLYEKTTTCYFFGVSFAIGLVSLPCGSADIWPAFLTSGDAVVLAGDAFGSTVGLTDGLVNGVAGVTGAGVEIGLVSGLFGVVFVVPPLHAPKTAVLTAKTDAKTNVLLILFLFEYSKHGFVPPAS